MRKNLINARKEKHLTQKQVAEIVGISVSLYQKLETGERLGKIATWDALEDLFIINQRVLRTMF